jgi:hypothetical protein
MTPAPSPASPLQILAGPAALRHVRDHGLRLDDIDVLVGAAGGTKFLMLGELDRVLFTALAAAPRARPLHCVGSSIGSWRLACLACSNPAAAIDRLGHAYLGERRYRPRAPASVVSTIRDDLLSATFGPESAASIVDHPSFRLHVLASRSAGASRREHRRRLALRLGFAAMANLVNRRTLGWQFQRAVFHSGGDAGPLDGVGDLPTAHETLDASNLRAVLSASTAVPFLMPGVSIPGAPAGVYRDAGLLDYNPVLAYGPSVRLVLYPHYFDYLTPGWFDRSLRSRRAPADVLDRTLLLAPSERFLRRLPGRERPRRADFGRFSDRERERRWRAVWGASAELGDALGELLATGPGRASLHVRPLP